MSWVGQKSAGLGLPEHGNINTESTQRNLRFCASQYWTGIWVFKPIEQTITSKECVNKLSLCNSTMCLGPALGQSSDVCGTGNRETFTASILLTSKKQNVMDALHKTRTCCVTFWALLRVISRGLSSGIKKERGCKWHTNQTNTLQKQAWEIRVRRLCHFQMRMARNVITHRYESSCVCVFVCGMPHSQRSKGTPWLQASSQACPSETRGQISNWLR